MTKKEDLERRIRKETVNWDLAVLTTDRHTGMHSDVCDYIVKSYIADNAKRIKYFIDLGDGLDNPFMSKFPVDAEYALSAQEEFDMFAEYLTEIDNLIPNAQKIILEGNHDAGRLDNTKRLNRGIASLRNIQYENVLTDSLLESGANIKRFILGNKTHIVELTKNNRMLLTHGDPKLDPRIKGGVTGVRRTAETYPFDGDIYMGHGHWYQQSPRQYNGKHVVMLGGLFDIEKMKKAYLNHHPYENGFGVVKFNKKRDLRFFQYVPINKGIANVGGVSYDYNKRSKKK